jgi:hypothetical protein
MTAAQVQDVGRFLRPKTIARRSRLKLIGRLPRGPGVLGPNPGRTRYETAHTKTTPPPLRLKAMCTLSGQRSQMRGGKWWEKHTMTQTEVGSQNFFVRPFVARVFNADPGGSRRRGSLYVEVL